MPEGKEPPDGTDESKDEEQSDDNVDQSPAPDPDELKNLREAKAALPDDKIDDILRKAFGTPAPSPQGTQPSEKLPDSFDERFWKRLEEAEESEENNIDPATGLPFPPNVRPLPERLDDSDREPPDPNQPPPRPPLPGPGHPQGPQGPRGPQGPTGGDNGNSSK